MQRKDFLKGIGLAGAASLIPFSKTFAGEASGNKPASCVLIPTETAGPFPLDLTTNNYYFRQDVREDRAGVPLRVRLKIIGEDDCSVMANVRVNIWHCDKDGVYSGYDTPQNPGGSADTKWLRGYQMTDANGEVEFITIFPGWYAGRICHIHFQVYVSSTYAAISQLSFDIAEKNALYAAHADIYTKGVDPMSFAQDNVFSDGYAYQVATLSANEEGGYDTYLEVTVKGSGGTAIGNIEKENARQFQLGQNYPNPYRNSTTIPFTLNNASKVYFALIDLTGRKVAHLDLGMLQAGEHSLPLDVDALGIGYGNYVYQIRVENNRGIFLQAKMMTAFR